MCRLSIAGGIKKAWRCEMLTAAAKEAVKNEEGYMCFCCQKQFASSDLTIHHIKPRAKGGSDRRSNLTAACVPCHRRIHKFGENKARQRAKEEQAKKVKMFVAYCHTCLDYTPRAGRNRMCTRCMERWERIRLERAAHFAELQTKAQPTPRAESEGE